MDLVAGQRDRSRGWLAFGGGLNPRALMDNEYVEFTKDMEPIDTVQHTEGTAQQPASAANPLRPTALISER